jgi:hypothetical protein
LNNRAAAPRALGVTSPQRWPSVPDIPAPHSHLSSSLLPLAMAARHGFAISPHAFLREVFIYFRPSPN